MKNIFSVRALGCLITVQIIEQQKAMEKKVTKDYNWLNPYSLVHHRHVATVTWCLTMFDEDFQRFVGRSGSCCVDRVKPVVTTLTRLGTMLKLKWNQLHERRMKLISRDKNVL